MTDDETDVPRDVEEGGETPSLRDALRPHLELLKDTLGRPFAVPLAGDKRARRMEGEHFEDFLRAVAFDLTGGYPKRYPLRDAIDELRAEAKHRGAVTDIRTRVASRDGRIFLDIADDAGRAIEVRSGSWTVRDDGAAVFAKHKTHLPLVEPRRGGDLTKLRRFVNVSDEDFALVVGWILMALRADHAHPLLILEGEPGSGKSTASRLLKRLLDPSQAEVRALPRDPRQLAVAADANWVLAFDNISGISADMSDALCRLSTGGAYGTRALYTNDEEQIFQQLRPVILNGIEGIATRQDLLDRAVLVHLERFDQHLDERSLEDEWSASAPDILGGLLDVAAAGLSRLDELPAASGARLADFERWCAACEEELGHPRGHLALLLRRNQEASLSSSLDASPVAAELRHLLRARGDAFDGTPVELYSLLSARVGDKRVGWPRHANAMSRQLKTMRQALLASGLRGEFGHAGRDAAKRRIIRAELFGVGAGERLPGDGGDGGDGQVAGA